jgi:hypothetical protein
MVTLLPKHRVGIALGIQELGSNNLLIAGGWGDAPIRVSHVGSLIVELGSIDKVLDHSFEQIKRVIIECEI